MNEIICLLNIQAKRPENRLLCRSEFYLQLSTSEGRSYNNEDKSVDLLLKTLHIVLIVNLLTSSVGVVINQHFCKRELKHMSLFTAVKSCHDAKAVPCPMHTGKETSGLEGKDCCNNTSQFFKTSQEQQVGQSDLVDMLFVKVIKHFPSSLILLKQIAPRDGISDYRPPPHIIDFPSCFQVFRL